jgi:hypothetical protein
MATSDVSRWLSAVSKVLPDSEKERIGDMGAIAATFTDRIYARGWIAFASGHSYQIATSRQPEMAWRVAWHTVRSCGVTPTLAHVRGLVDAMTGVA